ncbi:nuclear transport factor 2 family protein [Haliea sp. E17]|uniref:nuclear transport factor 2 family protein n=1 Tax=Haliea sp. E17 TaxID=3401576 RepID=UPI003AAC96FE
MANPDIEQRLAALESRVTQLEDQLAIHKLINSWGPAVDGDNPAAAASIWADDGVLLSELEDTRLEGPAAVAEMVRYEGHQQLIRAGSAHIQSFPVIELNGDTAKAVGFSRVYLHTADGGHEVWRVSANRWDFRRTPEGWRVTRRKNHRIDGGPEARAILNQAFEN